MILSLAVLCVAAAGLIIGAQLNTTDASTAVSSNTSAAVPSAVFAGTNTGAIPDGLSGTPPQYGAPRAINFAVSGVGGSISNIDVNMTLTHTWVGDVDVVLAAPGGSPSMVVVSRIGVTTAGSFGSASDYSGTYNFDDSAAGTNIWTAAATNPVPVGTYRTTAPGQTGQTNPAPVTSMQTTFGPLTPAQINGTWTLTFRDAASADIGTVTAANLTIDSATPTSDAPVDFNGDSRSDYVVVRNVGGGASGQVRWFYNLSSGGATVALDWGLATDFFVSEDFDGDSKDDVSVWRPGAATVAAFYILNSATNTARVEAFGQTGDDPTVVSDYNGDGKADLAVYRAGASAGLQSTWYYRTTAGGAVTFVPWGMNGDFPAPGDYDGNGSADFVVQRNNGGGQAAFWTRLSTGATSVQVFGTPTDVIVPGDYDGDGKTDIAVIRGISGVINWFYRPSGGGGDVNYIQFGASASDFPTQGDYDGDGKTDQAVWRAGTFWVRNNGTGAVSNFGLGAGGDYPVANFNAH